MRGSVAVAADYGDTGSRETEFRSDHVDDALRRVADIGQGHPEFLAVRAQLLHLLGRDGIYDGQRLVAGRDAVIHRGHRAVRTPDAHAAIPQSLKRLRGRHFVDQVQVDIQHGGGTRFVRHDMRFPDLIE